VPEGCHRLSGIALSSDALAHGPACYTHTRAVCTRGQASPSALHRCDWGVRLAQKGATHQRRTSELRFTDIEFTCPTRLAEPDGSSWYILQTLPTLRYSGHVLLPLHKVLYNCSHNDAANHYPRHMRGASLSCACACSRPAAHAVFSFSFGCSPLLGAVACVGGSATGASVVFGSAASG
jgi:hypothetical protein